MGPNKKDAVLQTTEMMNSVFATAGSYPLEGGYVYVGYLLSHSHFIFYLHPNFDRSMLFNMKPLSSNSVLGRTMSRSSLKSPSHSKKPPSFWVSVMEQPPP